MSSGALVYARGDVQTCRYLLISHDLAGLGALATRLAAEFQVSVGQPIDLRTIKHVECYGREIQARVVDCSSASFPVAQRLLLDAGVELDDRRLPNTQIFAITADPRSGGVAACRYINRITDRLRLHFAVELEAYPRYVDFKKTYKRPIARANELLGDSRQQDPASAQRSALEAELPALEALLERALAELETLRQDGALPPQGDRAWTDRLKALQRNLGKARKRCEGSSTKTPEGTAS